MVQATGRRKQGVEAQETQAADPENALRFRAFYPSPTLRVGPLPIFDGEDAIR
jgi:hypothetical protein